MNDVQPNGNRIVAAVVVQRIDPYLRCEVVTSAARTRTPSATWWQRLWQWLKRPPLSVVWKIENTKISSDALYLEFVRWGQGVYWRRVAESTTTSPCRITYTVDGHSPDEQPESPASDLLGRWEFASDDKTWHQATQTFDMVVFWPIDGRFPSGRIRVLIRLPVTVKATPPNSA